MMKPEDRELLKQEIVKYNSACNYRGEKVRTMNLSLISSVEGAFQDKKEAMRLLIRNDYGLLGNLMFKYARSGDEEIAELIETLDTKLIKDAYEKYGSKLITDGSGYGSFGLTILLNDHPELVSFVSDSRMDPQLALQVAARCPRIMEKISPMLKRDREFVKQMLELNPACLEWADWRFWSDAELAKKAVRENPDMIRCADIIIRRDRELFLHAVRQNGMLLFYADEDFRDDTEIVKAAVLNNRLALRYASERIKDMYEERDKRRDNIGNHRKRSEDQQTDPAVESSDQRL